jgi:hypothetical protein
MAFITSCSFITVEYFIESCRNVYFATEDYSIAVFIIVNAGLYYLFQEKSITDAQNGEFLEYHHLCRDNLETALSNWPLLQHSNKEMIEALLLGVGGPPQATSLPRVLANWTRPHMQSKSQSSLLATSSTVPPPKCARPLAGIVSRMWKMKPATQSYPSFGFVT